MSTQVKLTVIVPVFNMASDNRLTYCLDSLVGQSLQDPYEILAVDDSSTDDSGKIIEDYAKKYPEKVKSFKTDRNRKQGGAKNLALKHAQGEWIAFIDADDWVTPDYFERLLSVAEKTGADCVGCDYSLVSTHTMTPGQIVHNNKREQAGVLTPEKVRSLMIDFGSLCVKIYRREIILDCPSRFPEDMFYEDNALAKTWIFRMHHFEYLEEPLYFYYQHEDSTVHTVTMARLNDRVRAGKIMLGEAKKYGYFEAYRPEIEYSFTVLFYINTLFSCMRDMKEKGAYRFVKDLSGQMRQAFPEFENNPYYKARTNAEEKKLIHLQGKSNLAFYVYYRLLLWYRKKRYGHI